MNELNEKLEVYLREYEKLKSEQAQRIGFRDSILYVTLGLFGGILSFALSASPKYYALLVIPWVCLILGWTYLVNDEKILAIGTYIRLTLMEKIKEEIGSTNVEPIFGWEIVHRSDKRRKRRKIEQLIIDEITFVFSGMVSLVSFWFLMSNQLLIIQILSGIEFALLLILGWEIFMYADLDS